MTDALAAARRIVEAVEFNPERSRVTLRRHDVQLVLEALEAARTLNANQAESLERVASQLRSVRRELTQADEVARAEADKIDRLEMSAALQQNEVGNLSADLCAAFMDRDEALRDAAHWRDYAESRPAPTCWSAIAALCCLMFVAGAAVPYTLSGMDWRAFRWWA